MKYSISMSRSPRHRRPLIEALEPRLLFSATADIAVFDDGTSDGQYLAQAAAQTDLVSIYMPSDPVMMESQALDGDPQAYLAPSENRSVTTLVFVDTAVDDYETLVEDIRARVDADSVAIVYLDSSRDGIEQISEYLTGVSGISAIHIISHGVAGNLQLGTQVLNENNINQFKEQLTGWQTALGADADILLYGCDLAANQSGVNFLHELSELTGADVAASNDLTGNSRADADWVLEERIGVVETESLFAANEPMEWQGNLADVIHLYSGAPTHEQAIPTGSDVKQGIQLTSTQTVDRVQVSLANHGSASTSVIMTIHESSYNGPVRATASVNTSSIGGALGVVNFDFSAISFNAYTIYWIEFRTNDGADNLVGIGYINSNVIAGEFVVNNSGDSLRDMSIALIDVQNQAPTVANAIPNQNATEDSAFNFQFAANTFADVDVGNTLTYTAQLAGGGALPTWLSFDAATRTFSGTPLNANVGTVAIDVIANDGNGGTVTDTFNIAVANTNDAPTIANAIANQNATEDSAFNFQFAANTFADVDVGNTLTYTAQLAGGGALPSWLSFDAATRTFSGTPLNANVGTVAIDVIANDGNGGTVTDTFNIAVANTNDAPTIANAIANQNATEDSAFNFQFAANTFADVDVGNTLTYTAQLAGGGALPSWLSFDAATRTFSGTPLNGNVGTVAIDVIANDGNGGTVTDTFDIVVANVNDAPTVSIPLTDYYTNEQTAVNLHGTGITVNDVDSSIVTVTIAGPAPHSQLTANVGTTGATIFSGNSTSSLVITGTLNQVNDFLSGNNGGTLTFRLAGDTPAATATLTITANDGALSGNDTATINITALNDAPVNTVPGAQATDEDTALVFSAGNGNQIQVNDLDEGAGDLEVTLSVTNGTLTLAGVAGLVFTTGDGTSDSSLVFRGTQAAINTALATLTFNPTANFNGASVLTITTSDLGNTGSGGVLTDTDNVNITVNAVNDAPTIANAIPNQNATEDSAFNFQFAANTFADVDVGNTLTYTAQLAGGGALPTWLSFDAATRTFSGTPLNANVGTVAIDVIANDGNGGTVTDTFNVVVANTNDAPTIANAIANQNATEDSAFNFQFAANTFADVDVGNTLTYTAQLAGGGALPAWLSFNSGTRTFSGTPTNAFVGTVSIDVIANDGNGGTVTDTFDIVVANINDAPTVANVIPNQNATEDAAFNFQFAANTFDDVDVGNTLTYSAQLAGGGALPAWLSFDAATRTFSGTPTNAFVGTVSIDVIANDGNGGTVTDTFDIVVANTNDAPTVANPIPNQTATENALFNFSYAVNTFNDQDVGNTLTYTAQLAGGGALPAWLSFDGATRTFSGTPSNGDVGTISVQVTATDGSAASVSDFFDLEVQNVGSSNVIYETSGPAGNTQTLSVGVPLYQSFLHDSVGPTYTVDSIVIQLVKDPAASAQTITVSLISGTYNGVVLASDTISSADIGTTIGWKAFTFAGEALDDNQLYFIKVETSSADGLVRAGIHNTDVYPNGSFHSSFGVADTSRDLAFQVSSGSNTNPVLVNPIANQNATEDAAYNFQFAANVFDDVDMGDALTYNATMADGSALPGWLSFDPLTRTFSGTPLNGDVGTISIRVTADDSHGGTLASDTFDLTIANTNDAPTVANPVPNQNATEDQAFNFTFAANTFADQDVGNTLTYSAQLAGGGALPAWLSFDSATRTFTGTPLNAHVGSVAIDVIASDGNGGTVTDTFNIVVANTNDAPTVANPIANQNATEDTPYSFQFPLNTFSDMDVGDTLTYSAQLAGGAALPAWLSFDSATRTFSGTPANGDVGNFSIELIASDGNGGSVTDYFDVEVTNINDAPTVVIVPTDYYADEQIYIDLHGTGIVVADDDGDALTITLSGAGSNSNLAATVGTTGVVLVSGYNTNTLILSGTAAQLNDLFAGNNGGTLSYRLSGDTPVATRLLTISASDGSLSGNDTAIINITAVNDAPENTVPGAQATDEDMALVFSAGNGNQIQVQDLDSAAGDLEITLSVTNGTLTLSGIAGLVFTTGDGAGDGSMVFRGTQANINTALATLTFNPTANFSGSSVLTITTSDLGNTGTGGVLTDTDNVNITVNAVADAPTIANAIPDQNATEDAVFNFQFALNTFSDVDVSDTLTYTAQLAGGGAIPAWLSFDPVTRTFSGTPLNANVGTVAIDVIANDGNGGTVTDTFDIVVANSNDAPTVVNAIPNQNATEDTAFNFQFAANTFADVDVGNTLTYTAQLAGGGAIPAWLSFDPATRTFSGTPLNANVGTVSIDVIASDGNGGTVTDTFDIVVANSNDAPTIANAIPNQNATEDAAFNFQFAANTFADVDVGNTLTYTAQLAGGGAIPAWLSFDPVTRTFSGTPLNANVGTVSIDVIASDGNGGTVTDTFDIVVANANDAPTIANAIPNQNATEDAAFNFQFAANTFADVDVGNTLTYTAQLAGGGAIPAWLSFDPVTRTFSGTPLNANVGTVSIDVIANDGNGGTVTDTFDIVVANSNDAPTIANAIPNQNATEDAAFNFQFAANTFADVDAGNTLTYTAQLAGGGAIPAWLSFDPVTRTFSGTPLNANVGTVSIDVIANDGNGGTVTDTFDIVVANANDAPTIANAIPNQNATEDAAFNFQFAANTFADVDAGNTLTYTAQLAGGGAIPAWLSFDPVTRTFSGTPLNANVGTVSIDVIASDGNGGTVTDTFDIVVANANDAPTIANAIPNQNAIEDAAFNFQFAANTFADVDVGNTLTYTAQLAGGGAIPAWLSFDPVTRTFSGTPLNANVGTVSIDVIANDGNGGNVTDIFDIVIANANDAPTVANAIPNQNATEDAAFNFQFAANTFADVDVGNTLTYTAQLAGGGAIPAWLSFDPVTRTFSGTPLNANVGTVSIDVIASDGNGGTVTDTFDIVVANANDAPTIANAIPNQNAIEDAAFNFQFAANTFADVDVGNTLTYTAQLAGGGAIPAWLSFDPVTRTFSGTPLNANVGTVSIDVIANDGNGGTVTDTFDIVVANANDAPTVTNAIPNQNATEDTAFNFQLAANTFADVDVGNTLTYTAQLAGGGAIPAWLSFDPVTRTFSGTPLNANVGTVSIDVIANDGNGGNVTDTFDIVIANANDAPTVANAIPNQNATEDAAFNFQFAANTFADVDVGNTLTYTAQLAGGGAIPAWLSFDPVSRTFSGTPLNANVGTVSIDVIANDGNGGTVTDTFNIVVVNVNDAPITSGLAAVNNLEDAFGNTVDLFGAFGDEETPSNQLQYSVVSNSNPSLVSGAVIDPVTGKLQLSYGANQFGSADLIIRALDAQGASVETSLRVNIESVNDLPGSTGIADVKVDAGTSPQQMNVRTAFNDVEDGSQLRYSVIGNSNPAITPNVQIDAATGVMLVSFSSSAGGESVITLRAHDGNGAWVDTQFKVIVTALDLGVGEPITPEEPINIPPMLPPTTPPIELPAVEVPTGGGDLPPSPNPGGDTDTIAPGTGGVGSPGVINGVDEQTDIGYVKDKSSRDYARAEELLNGVNVSLTTLTASTSLVSLISPDAGFAPWEAADFDNEVRRIRAQMDDAMEEEQDRKAVVAGLTFSVTTGLLVWSLRASSLLLTMMSMLPLWRGIDPLPILDEVNKKKKELEQQRKDREREDKSAKEVGYLFDHAQKKGSRP